MQKLIRKIWILAAVFATFSGCASTLKKPYFWSAEKDGRVVYLLGTVHIGMPYEDMPGWIIDELDRANATAFERDIHDFDSDTLEVERKKERLHFALRKETEPKLEKILSPRAWKFISQRYGPKMSPGFFDMVTPYAAAGLIGGDPDFEQEKIVVGNLTYQRLNPEFSLDLNLIRRARKLRKPLTELDSVWKNRRTCEIEQARNDVENFMVGKRTSNQILIDLLENYRAGETAPIIAILNQGEPSSNRCLLNERNQLWIPQIESLHQRNSRVFVAVGLAHLVYGDENVLRLLEKRGFRIRRRVTAPAK